MTTAGILSVLLFGAVLTLAIMYSANSGTPRGARASLFHMSGAAAFVVVMDLVYDRIADTFFYVDEARKGVPQIEQIEFGTGVVVFLTSLLFTVIPSTALAGGAIFALTSLVARLRILRAIGKQQFARYVAFSPSVTFFNSNIGKDGLVFAAITAVCFAKKAQTIVFGCLSVAVIRPHIGLLLLPLAAVRCLASFNGGSAAKFLTVIGLTATAVLGGQFVFAQAGSEASAEAVVLRLERSSTDLSQGTTSPGWYQELPPPARTLLLPLRPLTLTGPLQVVGLLDSLWLTIAVAVSLRSREKGGSRPVTLSALIFIVAVATLLAYIPNEGLVMRQRTMLLPPIAMLLAGQGYLESGMKGHRIGEQTPKHKVAASA